MGKAAARGWVLLTGSAAVLCTQRNPVTAHGRQELGGRDLLCDMTNTSKVPYFLVSQALTFPWTLMKKLRPLCWLRWAGSLDWLNGLFEDNTVHEVHVSNALPV